VKVRFLTTLFLIIFIISLAVRIGKVDYPLSFGFVWGDGTRDYLVANHILKYQEFPQLGPFNLLFDSGIYGSALYFYILALMLFFFNSVLTLSIVNILLQLAVVVLIYQISKNLFDHPTALIASVLFSFNIEILHHSDYIWQPYLMQPVIYLALFFLAQTLIQKVHLKLFLSLFFLSLAITLHNSAFPWLPVFLLAATLILKRDHRPFKYYLGVVLALILPAMTFYLPVVVYKLGQFNQISPGVGRIYVQSVLEYSSNLISNANQLLSAFGFKSESLFILVFMIIWYFFKIKDKTNQKKLTFLMLTLVILPIIFASFFNKIRLHYLILSMGTLTIFTAKIISSFARYKVMLGILLFLFFFKIFSSDFVFLKDYKSPFVDYNLIETITDNIKHELEFIQKKDGFSDFSFFKVRSFAKAREVFYYPVLDTILLVPLEDKLNQKLSYVSDNSPYNHVQIGGDQYLVVTCYQVECLEVFRRQHSQYDILKKIYGSYRIFVYLAKLHE